MKFLPKVFISICIWVYAKTVIPFFCYAFVFELQLEPDISEAVVKEEFLKYGFRWELDPDS